MNTLWWKCGMCNIVLFFMCKFNRCNGSDRNIRHLAIRRHAQNLQCHRPRSEQFNHMWAAMVWLKVWMVPMLQSCRSQCRITRNSRCKVGVRCERPVSTFARFNTEWLFVRELHVHKRYVYYTYRTPLPNNFRIHKIIRLWCAFYSNLFQHNNSSSHTLETNWHSQANQQTKQYTSGWSLRNSRCWLP